MLQPRIPVNPLPTGTPIPLLKPTPIADIKPTTDHTTAPAPVLPARTTIQLTPGSALAFAAGGGAVVLVVGAVLVSMLLAVAITGASIAVVSVVLRLLVRDMQKGR
ncbi:SpdD-like protein [Streptomyces tanashiensis]|uniref:SpdD-like protein n=1 Tax=Streptomyces tanashiensis TaxID=67367 RepID=A0ABY6R183_9ACTN|nr:SpdD-like protein [Streptomyces tanashiensis]UZX23179.1 SpdD-like protein [Streptomyces tanashiensis]